MSGALIFVRVVRRQQQMIAATDANTSTGAAPLTHREMIRESLHFLGLRVSVRMTQAVPIVVIEKVAGAAVVGVIGAFARISELLGFPFAVIGNALSVRAQEVLLKDRRAIDALWDTVLRFLCVATAVAGGIVLVSVPLTAFLLPDDPAAAPLVAILSATIVTAAAAAMIGPVSDYIGALPKRVALITLIVLAEIPFLYAGGRFFGAIGAVAAYIVALLFTSVGFGIIAKRAFFGRDSYRPARDVMALLAVVMLAFAVALAAGLVAPPRWPAMWVAAVRAASYVLVLIAAILLTPSLRRTLLSGSLFDFTARAPSISAPGESELTPT
jgi:O-antigen/teichoic acid export membrane protein